MPSKMIPFNRADDESWTFGISGSRTRRSAWNLAAGLCAYSLTMNSKDWGSLDIPVVSYGITDIDVRSGAFRDVDTRNRLISDHIHHKLQIYRDIHKEVISGP